MSVCNHDGQQQKDRALPTAVPPGPSSLDRTTVMASPMDDAVVASVAPTSGAEGTMAVLSASTGARVCELRSGGRGGAPAGCVARLQDGSRVAAVASAAPGRKVNAASAIYVWEWGREQPLLRNYAPARVSALLQPARAHCDRACSSSFPLLVAGCHSGSVIAWEVSSGRLLRTWQAHYRGVSALCLSPDGSLLLSGGEDGVVHVWPLIAALAPAAGGGAARALHSWSHHTMPVTCIATGARGSGGGGLAVTASMDGTLKLYSIAQGSLLRTCAVGPAVSCIALDPTDAAVYAGCHDGSVRRVSLRPGPVGGDGAQDGPAAAAGGDGEEPAAMKGCTHKRFVSSLALDASGCLLASGSDDGVVHFFDTATMQSARRIAFGSAVTNVFFSSLAAATKRTGGEHAARGPPITPLAKYSQTQSPALKPWEDTLLPPREGHGLARGGEHPRDPAGPGGDWADGGDRADGGDWADGGFSSFGAITTTLSSYGVLQRLSEEHGAGAGPR